MQKGPELLADILGRLVARYQNKNKDQDKNQGIQIAFVADGEFQRHFYDIIAMEKLQGSVAIHHFDEKISRLGFAASDYMLMPSKFEPCGLTQMIAMKYGTLPIVRKTGGLKDTVSQLNLDEHEGNGFVFEDYDAEGLMWGIDKAMDFAQHPQSVKADEIKRIMLESASRFTHEQTAAQYVALYEDMLGRPLES